MSDIITNPISSNDVIEVGVAKPKCFTDCGNTLNDWLKWLAYDKCATDWSTIDISGIEDYLNDGDTSDQDLEKVVQKIIDAVNSLIDSNESNCCDTTTEILTLKNSWTSSTQAKATKKNGTVFIQGEVTAGSGVIATLPLAYRPTRARYIPVACLDVNYPVYIVVGTNGDLTPTTAGTIGDVETIYLDLSFII